MLEFKFSELSEFQKKFFKLTKVVKSVGNEVNFKAEFPKPSGNVVNIG